MYTREEFENHRIKSAEEMSADRELQREALDVLVKADRYSWVHQTTWMGEPILNLPQDMFALQEIIFNTRPEYIIEVGVAWGGSLLFYSTLMEVLGGKKIIGIDVFIPEDLRERIGAFGKISEKIIWLNGSSIENQVVKQVRDIIGDSKKVLVILDSNHTHEHVLAELKIYSEFVGKGHYIVCGDTILDRIPPQAHRPREWGPGNNPATAMCRFLQENDRFEMDNRIGNKLLLTCNPEGYLKCCKD